MKHDHAPLLDMTPDGRFRRPAPVLSMGTRLAIGAALVALVAGAAAIAAFLLWIAAMLVPVAIVAGLVAYAAFRFQLWRARGSVRGQRSVFRP